MSEDEVIQTNEKIERLLQVKRSVGQTDPDLDDFSIRVSMAVRGVKSDDPVDRVLEAARPLPYRARRIDALYFEGVAFGYVERTPDCEVPGANPDEQRWLDAAFAVWAKSKVHGTTNEIIDAYLNYTALRRVFEPNWS